MRRNERAADERRSEREKIGEEDGKIGRTKTERSEKIVEEGRILGEGEFGISLEIE